MVEAGRSRQFSVAAAEDQDVGRPPPAPSLVEEPSHVMRADRALEAMKDEQARRRAAVAHRGIQPADLELVAIGCRPPFGAGRDPRWTARELSPEGLEV